MSDELSAAIHSLVVYMLAEPGAETILDTPSGWRKLANQLKLQLDIAYNNAGRLNARGHWSVLVAREFGAEMTLQYSVVFAINGIHVLVFYK